MHHLADQFFVHAFLTQQSGDILFVEVGCRDRQTVAEVSPRRAFDLFVETVLVVRFKCSRCGFETFLRHFVGMLVADTGHVGILLDLLAQHNQQHDRYKKPKKAE